MAQIGAGRPPRPCSGRARTCAARRRRRGEAKVRRARVSCNVGARRAQYAVAAWPAGARAAVRRPPALCPAHDATRHGATRLRLALCQWSAANGNANDRQPCRHIVTCAHWQLSRVRLPMLTGMPCWHHVASECISVGELALHALARPPSRTRETRARHAKRSESEALLKAKRAGQLRGPAWCA